MIQRAAQSRKISLAEWVREALALALDKELKSSIRSKLEAVRRAVQFEFPIGDLDQLLAERKQVPRGVNSTRDDSK
jgi:hypothetical protein